MDENKKYLLMNLIQDYVMRTGELPDVKQLQALGMSAPDIIKYLKIYPRGCKSLSQNTIEYLKGILNKLPELKVINMSGCLITTEVIKQLNKSNIELVIYDSTFFLNLENFNLVELLSMANPQITFKDSKWFDFYMGLAEMLSGRRIKTKENYDYTNNGVKKHIKDLLKKGFNAQSGLDGLINVYIYGFRYGHQDFPHFHYYRNTEKRVADYHFKTLVNIFLKHGAKLRLGMLIPTLDFYNIRNSDIEDYALEDISSNIEMQAMILRTFYEIDKSLIIPQIYNYLPKNWKSIIPLDWDEELSTISLETLIYKYFKQKLYSYDVEI